MLQHISTKYHPDRSTFGKVADEKYIKYIYFLIIMEDSHADGWGMAVKKDSSDVDNHYAWAAVASVL